MKHFCLLALILLAGCQSDSIELEKKIVEFAKNDQQIDQKEYETLVELVGSYDNRISKAFRGKSGKIDDEKFVNYIKKVLQSQKMPSVEINYDNAASSQAAPFNVNVFLENSKSMDGYVKRGGDASFKTAVSNLLADIKISNVCDSLNLGYINKVILYQKKNASSPGIQHFFETLDPDTFRDKGGDRSVSDLSSILERVLQTVDDRNAAIVISDFVFSPGRNAQAQEYLNVQSMSIKMNFAEKRRSFDLATIIVQLESDFDGKYYDKTNTPIQLTAKRPYYIWILGSKQQVKQILKSKLVDNIKGYQHKLLLHAIKDEQPPAFKIMYKPQIGRFDAKLLPEGIITNAVMSKDGKFGFNMAVNFSNGLLEEEYVVDTANYILSNSHYHLTVEAIQDKSNPALNGFTHLLHLSTDQLRDEMLEISVVGKPPSWVYTASSQDDSNILQDDDEKRRTFGFRYLVEGVCSAFYPAAASNTLCKFNIQIKK